MGRTALGMTVALATLALSACTPGFYGGVVVFGPADDETEVQGAEG
jgi:hypothetical protein